MALTATNYPTTVQRHIGNGPSIIKTFYPTAATSYLMGDFVVVGATGRLTKQGTDQTAITGIVAADVDNSAGASDNTDKMVPVIVKGNVWVDFLISDTTYLGIDIGTQCTIAGDSGTTCAEGQSVANISGATVLPFTSLCIQAATLAIAKKKALFFFKGHDGRWA
jgi:predicted dehydrogenase